MAYIDTDLAYAAGVMDSDGCISVGRCRVKNGYSYMVTVCVAMKMDDVPLWFLSKFGGRIKQKKQSRPGYPPMHCWLLYCKDAADFLDSIIPYLELKRHRAMAASELARSHRKRGGGRGYRYGQSPLDETEMDNRARLASIVRCENQKSNSRVAMTAKSLLVN